MADQDTINRRLALAGNLFQNLGSHRRRNGRVSPVEVLMGLEAQKTAQANSAAQAAYKQAQAEKLKQEELRKQKQLEYFTQLAGGGGQSAPMPGQGQGMLPVGAPTPMQGQQGGSYDQEIAKYALGTGDFKGALGMMVESKKPMSAAERAADEDRDATRALSENRLNFDKDRYEKDSSYRAIVDQAELSLKQLENARQQTKHENEQEDRARAEATEKRKAKGKWKAAMDDSDLALRTVERLAEKNNAMTQGPLGTVIKFVPGTDAKDVAEAQKVLLGKLTLGTMAELKELSANGSTGFGQVNEKELENLQNARVNLSQATSTEERAYWLNEAYKWYSAVRQGLNADGVENGWEWIAQPDMPGYNSSDEDQSLDDLLKQYQ